MVEFYKGNETGHTIGILDAPYFWWEAGAIFDTLVKYWTLTGDSQYNGIVSQGLVAQQGENGDFMPANQTKSEGNDDQGVWALAAMSAAEAKFPEPAGTTWINLANAVFNEQVVRWDSATCGGGLRWQIFPFNTGYGYKNSISNGEFFELASRLARFTGNSTYSDWATKAYEWTKTVAFIDANYNVFDGAHLTTNCTDINKVQFSYTVGSFIAGVANMYNISSADAKWKTELDGLLNTTVSVFFPDGIAFEVACEARATCTTDMFAFKGILAQSLTQSIQLAPYTAQIINPLLISSAQAAAKVCTGTGCSFFWSGPVPTGDTNYTSGVGEQLSALSYVQALLVGKAAAPATGSNTTTTSPPSASGTTPANTTKPNAGVALEFGRCGLAVGLGSTVLGSIAFLAL
jgi:mannan endo-1,6-alpha-mannosidase